MVHTIHQNSKNQKKQTACNDHAKIDEVIEEMSLLNTKEIDDKNSTTTSDENNNSTNTTSAVSSSSTTSMSDTPPPSPDKKLKSQSFSVLTYDQVNRLHNVIEQVTPIHGRGNFPTLDIKLKDLVKVVRTKLEVEQSVRVTDVRLNGGAATYVLLPENSTYNDLDLIFAVDLSDAAIFDRIRTAVLDSLLEFFPEGANRNRISSCSLKDAYIHKMVKVNDRLDKWSLISLSNNRGRNVELKFVDKMQRKFEFSVDSFHISLDSLTKFYECSEMAISEMIYPTVIAESVYGDFNEAFSHLENKIIATRQVEQIRGGGLLKYCNLLIRHYKPSDDIKKLERYMCSRFFIDFSDLQSQRNKLESYLLNHFNNDDWTKTSYLMQLYKVVDDSTVCLMGHERRQTLALIEEMAYRFYLRSQQTSSQANNTAQSATGQHCSPHHHYSLHFPTHIGKQANSQYFPHFHHHLIRPHHSHFDLIVTAQQQTNQPNDQLSNNVSTSKKSNSSSPASGHQTSGTSVLSTASHSSSTCSTNNHSNNSKSDSATLTKSSNAHSNRSNTNNHSTANHHNSNNSTSNCNKNAGAKAQQQKYHAYLFGTGASTFYHYNPYHHHSMHQAHNGCFNSMSCQCGWPGGWMACA